MSPHDQANLDFLLSASEAVLTDWYQKVSHDDHIYASEIMSEYSEELAMGTSYPDKDLTVANLVLDRYRL